jgi:hypothetical protein
VSRPEQAPDRSGQALARVPGHELALLQIREQRRQARQHHADRRRRETVRALRLDEGADLGGVEFRRSEVAEGGVQMESPTISFDGSSTKCVIAASLPVRSENTKRRSESGIRKYTCVTIGEEPQLDG